VSLKTRYHLPKYKASH